MTQCQEARCAPANSSQSSGFIEFGDEAPHVFSGPMDGDLHLIIPQQEVPETGFNRSSCFLLWLKQRDKGRK